MTPLAAVLLVSSDEAVAEEFRDTLAPESGVRVLVTSRLAEVLAMVRDARPDLVVIDHALVNGAAPELCRSIRSRPGTADAMIVLLVEPGNDRLKRAGLGFGVDEYLTRPLEPADLLAKVRWMRRIRRVNEELRSDRLELERLQLELHRGFEHLLELLVSLVEMRLPGAAARGERAAELALELAERFEVPVPMRRDLAIAARLHEMGRVLAGKEEPGPEPRSQGARDTRFVLATRTLLQRVDGLAEAADLVGAIFENWDGSGFPDHLRQGQIPMRSRILRVVIDFLGMLAAPDSPAPEVVVERLDEHRGTCYDPVVMVQLRELLASAPLGELRDARVRLAIEDLHVGMVLAEDLCTDSGLKLLARGTRLSAPVLEIIQRRHRLEPLLEGATVQRQPA